MGQSSITPSVSTPKRWHQFSVRTLLLVAVVVAVAAAALSRKNDPAMDGYCPVSLTDMHRWVAGRREFSASHDGVRYYFAGKAERDNFRSNPSKYAVAAAGDDVVLIKDKGLRVPGSRAFGYRFDGRTYLFSSRSTMKEFAKTPQAYAK